MELFRVPLTSARQEMFAGFSFWCNIEWFLGENIHAPTLLWWTLSPVLVIADPPHHAHRTTHFPRTRPTHKWGTCTQEGQNCKREECCFSTNIGAWQWFISWKGRLVISLPHLPGMAFFTMHFLLPSIFQVTGIKHCWGRCCNEVVLMSRLRIWGLRP